MNYYYEENTWGERFIPSLNRTTFEKNSAASHFENELDFDPMEANKLTIIAGSDSGLLFKYLYCLPIPVSSRVILIEPDDVFEAVHEESRQWLSTQAAQTEKSPVSMHSAGSFELEIFNGEDIAYFFAGKMKLEQANCAIHDYQNIYYPLYREIREALSKRSYTVNQQYSVKSYVEQQLKNCVDNHTPLLARHDFGKDKVAVILGGGPSLDDQLDWVAQNRSKLFLISVSRICDKLQKRELIPDLVVSVDYQPVNYSAGKMGTLWEHVPLISSFHVSHQLVKEWRGPHYYTGYRYPWEAQDPLPIDVIESTGPTVGHSSIVIASRLGFSTILLAGIDLCFNANGDSHAQGTPEAELLKLPGNYDAQVTTYAGNRVGTSIDFFRSIESLENIGESFNPNLDTIFNLNVNAAKVSSIEYIDIEQVSLPSHKPEFDTSDYAPLATNQLDELKKQIIRYKQDFEKILTICSKAKVCIDKIYGKSGKQPNPEYHRRLDILEERLNKVDSYAIKIVRHFMAPEFAQLRKPSKFVEMDQADMERWAKDYYKITYRGGKYFQRAMKMILEIIELRKAEQAETPDIDYLLETWSSQETPGRVALFHERLLPFATEDQKKRLDTAKTTHFQSLSAKDEQREKFIVSIRGSIGKTMQSLRYLREKECVSDLQGYSEKLIDLEWPYGTIARFIQGVIAEFDQEFNLAIANYQQVIDECGEQVHNGSETLESISTLIEETLTNLTRIFLDQQDGDSAVSALGMLCEIAPQYIPSYANLLNILGNYESAVELLHIYLDNFKNDFRVARQLAMMHEKAGNTEAYQQAFKFSNDIRQVNTTNTKAA